MNWILENYQDVLAVIGGLVTFASIVVKITPSQKDDAFLEKVISILEKFSVFNKKPSV